MIEKIIQLLHTKKFIHSTTYTRIKESSNHDVYEISNSIIKIHTKKNKLYKEYQILQQIYGKIQCPQPLFFEEINTIGIKYFVLGMEKINGKPIDHFRSTLGIETKHNMVRDIINQIIKLHKHPLKQKNKNMNYFTFIYKKCLQSFNGANNNPHIKQSKINNIYKHFFSLYKKCSQQQKNVLIHNDIWYKNILIDDGGNFKGIIDFEEGLLGPKYIEYFRICDHLFFAKNYIEEGSEDYTEKEFIELLLDYYQKLYFKSTTDNNHPQRLLYSLHTYIKMISHFDKERYNHKEILRYEKEYIEPFI